MSELLSKDTKRTEYESGLQDLITVRLSIKPQAALPRKTLSSCGHVIANRRHSQRSDQNRERRACVPSAQPRYARITRLPSLPPSQPSWQLRAPKPRWEHLLPRCARPPVPYSRFGAPSTHSPSPVAERRYPHATGELGQAMMKSAEEFPPSSAFGQGLNHVGEALQKICDAQHGMVG